MAKALADTPEFAEHKETLQMENAGARVKERAITGILDGNVTFTGIGDDEKEELDLAAKVSELAP